MLPDSSETELVSSNEEGSFSSRLCMAVCLYSYFVLKTLGVICYNRCVLSKGHKNYFKDQ